MSTSLTATKESPPHLSTWHRYPSVYEINTWVWLSELSAKYGKNVTLASVPSAEWDEIAAFAFDAVWFMGVWERSPAGIAIANQNEGLLHDFMRALPDFRTDDNVGSPYCVRHYLVDQHLGGPNGLAIARQELSKRGMNLILDFVPNHVALDHSWVSEHPEYLIHGNANDARNDPSSYIESGGTVFALGRDPFFPAWPDVLQLNAFAPGLRQAAIDTVSSIAQQCDGIRCDMAMLFLNEIFERTWNGRAGQRPATEYWTDLILTVKKNYPGFLFIAEAYWDLEWQLQQLGFDFCYDKKLYDRLEHGDAEKIRLHLCADPPYLTKLLRFIENHDEPRAAATFSSAKQKAAALTIATLPGIKLFHEGQFDGRTVRLPVFLGRRPQEPVDRDMQGFYKKLLEAIDKPVFRDGEWSLCERTGWADNVSCLNLVAWSWLGGDERYLIIVNLSDYPAQSQVKVSCVDSGGGEWHLLDMMSGATYQRAGDEMRSPGLYVELAPWNFYFFDCQRVNKTE
jgi:Alpha amylase, catalytic domain